MITSTSLEPEAAEGFARLWTGTTRVLLELTASDGLHLGIQTAPLGEPSAEVVIPPTAAYVVVDEPRRRPDGVYTVTAHRATTLDEDAASYGPTGGPCGDPDMARRLARAAAALF
jgi:hypothetical protein